MFRRTGGIAQSPPIAVHTPDRAKRIQQRCQTARRRNGATNTSRRSDARRQRRCAFSTTARTDACAITRLTPERIENQWASVRIVNHPTERGVGTLLTFTKPLASPLRGGSGNGFDEQAKHTRTGTEISRRRAYTKSSPKRLALARRYSSLT